ncbi:Uma2 family endonuclease [Streptomyces aculeolatus]|uniref:Uma2 family endonuclease n=1 Tax=Streptomyces aculeolatus TaxID=270689 RepID=UPI000568E7F8|nr:Uma2 family endonuclease [Streptomyces aculeolatus]
MTLVDDRIEMADTDDKTHLDELFEVFERTPAFEGYRVEVVEGVVYMVPQRSVHWEIILEIIRALDRTFDGKIKVFSDVRIDFPGEENAFCPDVAKLRDDAKPDGMGRWRHQDVEFVAEVVSRGTGKNDYGPKKTAYALAGVPVYLIADPYQRKCHVYTEPGDGDYVKEVVVAFGAALDLKVTPLGFVLRTDRFPSD